MNYKIYIGQKLTDKIKHIFDDNFEYVKIYHINNKKFEANINSKRLNVEIDSSKNILDIWIG